jgi:hypothetical protein
LATTAAYDSGMSITDEHGLRTETENTIDLTQGTTRVESTPTQAGGRPQFTITDAAAACAVSRKTITRKLADLADHGAAKDEDGVWRIPVEALLAVGLHPGRSVPERHNGGGPAAVAARPTPRVVESAGPEMITVPRDRWDDLRIRLARAEAQAAERDLALADARLALRALTAAPVSAPAPEQAKTAGAAVDGIPAQVVPAAAPPSPGLSPGGVPTGSAEGAVPPATSVAVPTSDPATQMAIARSEAARSGGYVPAANTPPKRRRWWQSK